MSLHLTQSVALTKKKKLKTAKHIGKVFVGIPLSPHKYPLDLGRMMVVLVERNPEAVQESFVCKLLPGPGMCPVRPPARCPLCSR